MYESAFWQRSGGKTSLQRSMREVVCVECVAVSVCCIAYTRLARIIIIIVVSPPYLLARLFIYIVNLNLSWNQHFFMML